MIDKLCISSFEKFNRKHHVKYSPGGGAKA